MAGGPRNSQSTRPNTRVARSDAEALKEMSAINRCGLELAPVIKQRPSICVTTVGPPKPWGVLRLLMGLDVMAFTMGRKPAIVAA